MMYPYSYSYEYYYTGRFTFLVIAILAAVILSIVLYFTFLNKKNERKYKGFTGKIYNFFNFNKFYAEEILKLVYIISAAVLTVVSIVGIFSTAFLASLLILILGNIALRVTYELIMMFIILCRKTVSVDKKLDKIAASCGGETRTADSSSDGMKTTMCGGKPEVFDRVKPILEKCAAARQSKRLTAMAKRNQPSNAATKRNQLPTATTKQNQPLPTAVKRNQPQTTLAKLPRRQTLSPAAQRWTHSHKQAMKPFTSKLSVTPRRCRSLTTGKTPPETQG